ncbi:hypothetical protein DTO013E5_8304 [Penicillium roqueforti]|uniref:uncharacterized protein n=1 Tax=Penicillium roqueforti TaxID=5082 RepID=UPI00190978BF|nr:uncharacterized protein LCP9604111_8892 [Penicillium roqueforti]KAF9240128.1 hypothetical protein LCP9604111_8892 [Penicillium roqueforti]KAI2701226.1 hypothetical protein CBS147332_7828 [Penicillium roqueforti]KAI2739734.1 hypothetical protein DTO012A1_5729 [Penicillium roqueforti]KAI2750678.1 hypothetical protein DTO013F2_4337 [Penicillium roqueforti]KAI2769445.1 hypothetical protein DTO012A8_5593 [Penicillium roqueforti]
MRGAILSARLPLTERGWFFLADRTTVSVTIQSGQNLLLSSSGRSREAVRFASVDATEGSCHLPRKPWRKLTVE